MAYDPLFLPAGSLRTSVNIEQLSTSDDAWQDTTPDWTLVCAARVSISEQGGLAPKEALQSGQLASVTTHVVSMRWRSDVVIVPGMRVNYSGRLYRIQVVHNVNMRNRVWRLFVVDLQSNAE